MAAKLINGKEISGEIREKLKEEVALLLEQGIKPGLAVILVGDNQASRTYVTSKQKSCQDIGMESLLIEFPVDVPETILLEKIEQLNNDDQDAWYSGSAAASKPYIRGESDRNDLTR